MVALIFVCDSWQPSRDLSSRKFKLPIVYENDFVIYVRLNQNKKILELCRVHLSFVVHAK